METNFTESSNPYTHQESVPNNILVLILGILSIVSCWCYGIPGVIFAAIALILAKSGMKSYRENPGMYTTNSYKNLKIGRVMAIAGLIMSVFVLLGMIYLFVVHPELIDDARKLLEERQRQLHVPN